MNQCVAEFDFRAFNLRLGGFCLCCLGVGWGSVQAEVAG